MWLSSYQSYSIPHLHTLQTFAEADERNNSVKLTIKRTVWPPDRPYPQCEIHSGLHDQAGRHNWRSHDGWLKCVSDRVPLCNYQETADGVLTVVEVQPVGQDGQDAQDGCHHRHHSCHELCPNHSKKGNFNEALVSAVCLSKMRNPIDQNSLKTFQNIVELVCSTVSLLSP